MVKRIFLFVITTSLISASTLAMNGKNPWKQEEEQEETEKTEVKWNKEQLGNGTFFESFAIRKGNTKSPRAFKAAFAKDTPNRKELRHLWQNVFESITVNFAMIKDPIARFKFFFNVSPAMALFESYFRTKLTDEITEKLLKEGKIRERNAWYTTLLGGTALFAGGWFAKSWWDSRPK